jgi:hypothetical protein
MARRRSRRLTKPLLPGFWSLLAALLLIAGTLGMMWVVGKATVVRRDVLEKAVK